MLYTTVSFLIILVITYGVSYNRSKSNKYLLKEYKYFSVIHTNLLKGLATTFIIVSHVANLRGMSVLIPLGGIGVALFLISSGYGLNESFKRKGLDGFLKNRLLKILIPYWLIVFFHWIINMKEFNTQDFIASLVLLHRLPLSWFVYYIIMWYILFYLVMNCNIKCNTR